MVLPQSGCGTNAWLAVGHQITELQAADLHQTLCVGAQDRRYPCLLT